VRLWAIEESIARDRDLVLAHSLQRPENARKIVGVVGAGHLSGVGRLWEQVPTRWDCTSSRIQLRPIA
jgi:pheromone shutdown protein TraB